MEVRRGVLYFLPRFLLWGTKGRHNHVRLLCSLFCINNVQGNRRQATPEWAFVGRVLYNIVFFVDFRWYSSMRPAVSEFDARDIFP